MLVCDYIAEFISSKNAPVVFDLAGGMIAFLTDSIAELNKTQIIHVKNEQCAGFAAEVATRVSWSPAIAMATSGPGATNLITPITSCFFDSTPAVFITGQVNSRDIKTDISQRQKGFQELDIVSMVSQVTKYAVRINNAEDVPKIFEKAWLMATSGRPGPVLIDIPIDIQQQKIPFSHEISATTSNNIKNQKELEIDISDIYSQINEEIRKSTNPIILAGGGIRTSNSILNFQKFVEKIGLPVVTSLLGKDSVNNSFNLGVVGSYGSNFTNSVLLDSDLILILGSRLDVRQITNGMLNEIQKKKLIRIDVDPSEIRNSRVICDLNFELDLHIFLKHWEKIISIQHKLSTKLNLNSLNLEENPVETGYGDFVNPNLAMKIIAKHRSNTSGYIVDVGQHQMWAAQSLKLVNSQRFITSGGLGCMGFSIPGMLGASTSTQEIWNVIVGDGSLQINFSDLLTLQDNQCSGHIYIMNNRQLGMVAQFQDENLYSRHHGTRIGYAVPKFADICNGMGIKNEKIYTLNELENSLQKYNEYHGIVVFDIQISNKSKALPKTK